MNSFRFPRSRAFEKEKTLHVIGTLDVIVVNENPIYPQEFQVTFKPVVRGSGSCIVSQSQTIAVVEDPRCFEITDKKECWYGAQLYKRKSLTLDHQLITKFEKVPRKFSRHALPEVFRLRKSPTKVLFSTYMSLSELR